AGKGGVGKTCVAAATGIKTAEMGHRTVIMSLDVAHSLSDIFDLDKELLDHNRGRPIEVSSNLWIQEMDIQEEIEKNWGDIHKYISSLLNTTGLDEVLAEELSILPGMEEVSLLLYINGYVQAEMFDVIILDCAPTGESLRFISIPKTLEWYINKLFKIEKTIARYVGPIARKVYDVPIPGDLRETQRAFMYFCLYKMNIDGIIMNRVLPGDIKDQYFKEWVENQKMYMKDAEEYFSPIPIFYVNLFKGEILGYSLLKDLADQIYGEMNPMDRFFEGEPYSLIKEDGEYQLIIRLPFIIRDDVELNKISDELIIRIGSFKRHIMLPRQVAAAKSVKARYTDKHLRIYFKGDDHGKREGRQ
ncbi:MAG: ArsA family ATPase, partial [Deltaproteobacteria bacterium]|nr:ArsA family ATPase [Deltaproteobacteria bacterium]